MKPEIQQQFEQEISEIRQAGLYKRERIIESAQSSHIAVGGKDVLNFCANNYLGLANHPELLRAAKHGIDEFGLGLASVRFICGTQTIHKELERRLSEFHGTEDTILYGSCFDANTGLFETLLGENDAIISDTLNHASIIDGVRLCKSLRLRYEHANMNDLERCLEEAKSKNVRRMLITTDGVFSMDGDVGKLEEICSLAEKFGALVHVDESHATGFFGPTGRGACEYCGVQKRVDIVTSTLGKAMGGSTGGFTTGHKIIIELLRQRSRPYLFSNSVAPAVVAASLACLTLVEREPQLRARLMNNTKLFREEMTARGFSLKPGVHPIAPIMLGDAALAVSFADQMLQEGIYVIGFSFPVVPKGQARIRVQLSAAHSTADVERAIGAFTKIGKTLGVITGSAT